MFLATIRTTWILSSTEYAAVEFTGGAVATASGDTGAHPRLVDPRGLAVRPRLFLGARH
ncbi:hypothetical protein [Mobilicoccus pelagius]|uniref:Uncharacterized protein n=1 Tax=Mobilicoccus pelagius NBRC 104925 TaxID=1089455 RepID=H5URQ9_9MICO|nr:hypothetical protein [Mobilicoccus pelagius]GAB48417.1 hypothetical protein MOPEL_073_00570 [Mobilicoccus pelagius NBRC 104925]